MKTLLFALPCIMLCLPALAREVTLTVRNHSGVALTAQPVRGGVPFARGELTAPQAQLLDEQDKPLPCAVRPLSHWYDGSIKFLLVDAQVSLAPDQAMKLRLVTGGERGTTTHARHSEGQPPGQPRATSWHGPSAAPEARGARPRRPTGHRASPHAGGPRLDRPHPLT